MVKLKIVLGLVFDMRPSHNVKLNARQRPQSLANTILYCFEAN